MGQRWALSVYKYSTLLAVGPIQLRLPVVQGSPPPPLREGISTARWAEKKEGDIAEYKYLNTLKRVPF
jgi:hypothetical protein